LQIYSKIAAIWRAVAEAAAPFMRHQSSARHFEFFGMDVIADEQGDCWLIEANRSEPCVYSFCLSLQIFCVCPDFLVWRALTTIASRRTSSMTT
jgi:hypothetical protein